ncbi:hypothetical protein TorRG33x02_148340, partial [Trema orientale]
RPRPCLAKTQTRPKPGITPTCLAKNPACALACDLATRRRRSDPSGSTTTSRRTQPFARANAALIHTQDAQIAHPLMYHCSNEASQNQIKSEKEASQSAKPLLHLQRDPEPHHLPYCTEPTTRATLSLRPDLQGASHHCTPARTAPPAISASHRPSAVSRADQVIYVSAS